MRLKAQIAVGWPARPNNVLAELREFNTFADELTVCDDLFFKGQRLLIPLGARQAMLERVRSSHICQNGCIRSASEAIFYPGMIADIKAIVQACGICREYDATNQKERLLPHAVPTRPWEKVGMDIFCFRDKNYLITVEYLSTVIILKATACHHKSV
jgi:hypothetical protein